MMEKHISPLALGLIFGGVLSAQSTTTSGHFTAEPPTLVSLGFEWTITGDDNRNAKVDSSYRKKGETTWHPALPLMRVQREEIGAGSGPDGSTAATRYPLFRYTAGNMLAAGHQLGGYDVAPDGQRFLIGELVGEALNANPLVILNWPSALPR